MVGFNGQNNTISASTPTALVVSPGQRVYTGIRLKNTGSQTFYYGFYENDAAALSGLTASTGFPVSAGGEESIDCAAMKVNSIDGFGNLQYLYILSGSGTGTAAYWGV